MKTKDGKKVVYYCGSCSKVRPFTDWIIPNKDAKREIHAQRQRGYIRFIKSVCDKCIEVKR